MSNMSHNAYRETLSKLLHGKEKHRIKTVKVNKSLPIGIKVGLAKMGFNPVTDPLEADQ